MRRSKPKKVALPIIEIFTRNVNSSEVLQLKTNKAERSRTTSKEVLYSALFVFLRTRRQFAGINSNNL